MSSPGAPTKLLLAGYSDPEATALIDSVDAVINPDNYTLNYTINYKNTNEQGAVAPTQIFSSMESGNFDLELMVDGTGVIPIPGGLTVDAYIAKVMNIAYNYQGADHRPNYLRISWGNTSFTGVCKNISVKYTLFNTSGAALRALIKLTVIESVAFATKIKESGVSSPDLTHVRTVLAGDTLPLMTYRIYGEPGYYMEVARVNGLNSIHDIKPGDGLYFPPLKK
ncbi:peptidoglycan-binding protein [Chitinophaga polysaccharea]|uniref:CIS tube protein n=1 Tax=Chitinophaga TaxID=79328 RepID=UPI0014559757|nr:MULTISPECIES: peptidoglycan-binding protein [Chitinophaga]NLR56893.1 peptidoglycan-binding protein [Chitinophaga polysaccharea]NLU93115.1 peptidoglycan-binding protein [Chitinophaga sp. Ak27]